MNQNDQKLNFVREDWTSFRTVERLSAKAGVPDKWLRRLVVKELVDNALDAGGTCRLGELPDGGFYVMDDGPGIAPEDVPRLFSVLRPMETTKLWRMPTRGALGNGLRVVAGAVLASGGKLEVFTRGSKCQVSFDYGKGDVLVETTPMLGWTVGLYVAVELGEEIPLDKDYLSWGEQAIFMAQGTDYKGKTSPWWYTPDAFFELFQAAGDVPLREVISQFDGCTGRKASEIAGSSLGSHARKLTRVAAKLVLMRARDLTQPVKPDRLGLVGPDLFPTASYAKAFDTQSLPSGNGSKPGKLPYVFECWAEPADKDKISVSVNRTPITADVHLSRVKGGKLAIFGCGLSHPLNTGTQPLSFTVNILTPCMPIVSESKAPNLLALWFEGLGTVIEKAARKVKRVRVSRITEKDIILDSLDDAIAKASGEGKYRYSLRQLYYAVRPEILDTLSKEPNYNYFSAVITNYEAELGHDLRGIYRDNRGTLYHPHLQKEIALGTIAVEEYQRPEWTFNKILYSEKEGLISILREAKWSERHDCALLSSKGYASRAARDLLDFLGDTDEDISFFCIHDADGPGTMIYQSLQEATQARPGRRVKVINLGLEPTEALEMDLQVEAVSRKDDRDVSVANYVPKNWAQWLQKNRVELNAMSTPVFIDWLDAKFEQYAPGKVIPPTPIMGQYLDEHVREAVQAAETERILEEAGLDDAVEETMEALEPQLSIERGKLNSTVQDGLKQTPVENWKDPIKRLVRDLTTAMK